MGHSCWEIQLSAWNAQNETNKQTSNCCLVRTTHFLFWACRFLCGWKFCSEMSLVQPLRCRTAGLSIGTCCLRQPASVSSPSPGIRHNILICTLPNATFKILLNRLTFHFSALRLMIQCMRTPLPCCQHLSFITIVPFDLEVISNIGMMRQLKRPLCFPFYDQEILMMKLHQLWNTLSIYFTLSCFSLTRVVCWTSKFTEHLYLVQQQL